jgi:uncharacterized protein YaaN involved in tellurite resistance
MAEFFGPESGKEQIETHEVAWYNHPARVTINRTEKTILVQVTDNSGPTSKLFQDKIGNVMEIIDFGSRNADLASKEARKLWDQFNMDDDEDEDLD